MGDIEKDVAAWEHELKELKAEWQEARQRLEKVKDAKEELEKMRLELDRTVRSGDLARASELRYSIIPELEGTLSKGEGGAVGQGRKILDSAVTRELISSVASLSTGIRTESLLSGEREKLLDLDKLLKRSITGQDHAADAVSDCIRQHRTGLHGYERPQGVFLLLGPTGTGKAKLTKQLAATLFSHANAICRIDMSEFMEKHSASRLTGAPPGYIGFEQGGALTEAVRRKPYQIVLLDEFEKSHPEVSNILLPVFDDGRLTDLQGRTVNFKNTTIIMTSNSGSDLIAADTATGSNQITIDGPLGSRVMERVRSYFPPEFLNRIDEIVIFNKPNRQGHGPHCQNPARENHGKAARRAEDRAGHRA